MQKDILVVDDHPGIQLLLTDILESAGYRVVTAETGTEALEKVHAQAFDLLILDYKLPVLDGREVLARLEQQEMQVPVILISGLVEEMKMDEQNNGLLKGVLAKPFDVQAVSDMIEGVLHPS